MSAGRFAKSRYQSSYSDDNHIHPILIQPETLALSIDSTNNTAPTGAVTNPISAVISRGSRAKGLVPAYVTLTAPDEPPEGYKINGTTRVPLLDIAIRAKAAAADDTTPVNYLGVTGWRVSGYSPEKAR